MWKWPINYNLKKGIDYLAVAYADEGIALRKNGIERPIMVMNADEHSFDLLIDWKLEPEIYNKRSLLKMIEAAVEAETQDYPIHIKLDTGMIVLVLKNPNWMIGLNQRLMCLLRMRNSPRRFWLQSPHRITSGCRDELLVGTSVGL